MTDTDLTTRADALRRQLAERPGDSRARAELASITAQLGDYAAALDHDAGAWLLRPDDPSPILHMLGVLVDSGKWLGAFHAFEIARDGARPDTALALDLAATQVLRQFVGVFPPRGARPEADAVIDRLVANSQTRRPAIQLAVARSLIDIGRHADAVAMLDRIEGRESESIHAADLAHLAFLRGALCERAGDLEAACARYERALELAARPDAALNLLSILVEEPELDEIRVAAVLAKLDAHMRGLPLVRFREAIYLRRIGEHDRATALLSPIAADRTSELGRMARQVLASC